MPTDPGPAAGLAAPVATVLSALIAAFAGGFFGHLLAQRRERRKARDEATLRHLQQQVEELYGPLYGLITECYTIYQVACDILPTVPDPDNLVTNHRRVHIFNVPDDKLHKWQFLMEEYFIPLNRRAVELLRSKAHLLEDPGEPPDSLTQFLRHAVAFEALHRMAQKGMPTNEDVPGIGWPRTLQQEIGESVRRLRQEHGRFLHKLGSR